MNNAALKLDADGIDTEFEHAIGTAMKESERRATFTPHKSHGLRPVKSETPIDQAHRTFGRTQDLCTRIEALCSAMIGGVGEPANEDRPEAQGLMGQLARHGEETDARIAFTNKRLDDLERIMLGHGGGASTSTR